MVPAACCALPGLPQAVRLAVVRQIPAPRRVAEFHARRTGPSALGGRLAMALQPLCWHGARIAACLPRPRWRSRRLRASIWGTDQGPVAGPSSPRPAARARDLLRVSPLVRTSPRLQAYSGSAGDTLSNATQRIPTMDPLQVCGLPLDRIRRTTPTLLSCCRINPLL